MPAFKMSFILIVRVEGKLNNPFSKWICFSVIICVDGYADKYDSGNN